MDFEKFVEQFDDRSFYLVRIETSRCGCVAVDYGVMHSDCYGFIDNLIDCSDCKNGCEFEKMELQILGSNFKDLKTGKVFTDWKKVQFKEIDVGEIWQYINKGQDDDALFLKKYHEWQKRFGYKETEIYQDYLGGTTQTEWAVNNNIDCLDFDRWQTVQRVLKHAMDYSSASKIIDALYHNDIDIFDCE